MEKAVYRIIDANFNRAREALRVMEEFCRFGLNSRVFNQTLKDIRHQLCSNINKLDAGKMLCARDTVKDVGTDIRVENQLSRGDLFDCFTAAAKRLPEALRAISETAQTINPDIANKIEQLRYTSYTLEKEIYLFSTPAMRFAKVKLYVLLSESEPGRIAELTQKCSKGGADCIQLRCKGQIKSDKMLLEIAKDFVKICQDNNVISIVNDRPDIAILSGADGFHLGQDDISVSDAKELLLSPKIIGLSTHNMNQLENAIAENPTYVGLGPAFDTITKPHEKTAGLDYIEQAVEKLADSGIGHVAIGGINLENIGKLLEKGAKTIAVCSAITGSESPESACKRFKELLVA